MHLYGSYRYGVVRIQPQGGRYHVELLSRGHPDYIEVAFERSGWKVVAGGW